jgi:hypothetical protein
MSPKTVGACGLYIVTAPGKAPFLVEVRRSGFSKLFAENTAGVQCNLDEFRECDFRHATVRDIALKEASK